MRSDKVCKREKGVFAGEDVESRKGFFGGCKRPKPAEENRLGISNGAEKSNSRRFQTAWVDQIQCMGGWNQH